MIYKVHIIWTILCWAYRAYFIDTILVIQAVHIIKSSLKVYLDLKNLIFLKYAQKRVYQYWTKIFSFDKLLLTRSICVGVSNMEILKIGPNYELGFPIDVLVDSICISRQYLLFSQS